MELCNKTSQPASSKNNYQEKNKKKQETKTKTWVQVKKYQTIV